MGADDDNAKRRSQHDRSGESDALPIVRSEIWKFDGNIVLWTENVQFRVHQSCLADNSVVFKDMLSLPNVPATGETIVEGCPVVQLSDSAEDWRNVLKALYERRFFAALKKHSFPIIASILKLGSKYQFDDLRQEAVDILHHICDGGKQLSPLNLEDHVHIYRGILIDMANLASEHGLVDLLPVILLSIASYRKNPLHAIVEGKQRPDGSTAVLNLALMKSVLLGRQKLYADYIAYRFSWVHETDDRCHNPDACMDMKRRAALRIFPLGTVCTHDVVATDWVESWGRGLCKNCLDDAREVYRDGLDRIWTALPSYFGLATWDQLRNTAEY